MKVLITGSSGLIGSEAARFYDKQGHAVFGVDNNMRMMFFGPMGDTTWNLKQLLDSTNNFIHLDVDIRDSKALDDLFTENQFDLIIHSAAQPSHDKARDIPFVDFEVNAVGTLNLLEMTRRYSPDAVFINMSTNKVYGDAPNELSLVELEKRYDYADPQYREGIDESFRIDQSTHSLFGASKLAGDIVAQEYGRYFDMNVGIFRGGCLTGSSHSGVELHGFLSYLVKVIMTGGKYHIFGYKGKQVRDNIHSYDVIQAFESFRKNPKPGEVYNLGGGRQNSISILEALDMVEDLSGKKADWVYEEQNRIGDHICYISDLSKLKTHFPDWSITRSLEDILKEMIIAEKNRI